MEEVVVFVAFFCFCGIVWLRNQRRHRNFCVSNLVVVSVETNSLVFGRRDGPFLSELGVLLGPRSPET